MKLVFFDEAKHDPDYPHYHLGGVCVDEQDLVMVEAAMHEIARTAFGTAELTPETELHAAELYHRKRNFKTWNDFEKRIDLIAQVARVLSRDEVRRIDIQINCNLLTSSQSAEDIAFMFFCERANDLLRSYKSLGMLIGDRESDRLAARYSTTLSGYRARGTDFQFGRTIQNLVDSVHFTHSHLSRFLQLADVYTWILQFKNRNRTSNDERHRCLFKLLQHIDLGPAKYKEWPKPQT